MPYVSLIIPCYNEALNLPLLVQRCKKCFATYPEVEVVLVDNGSTDTTPAVLARLLQDEAQIRSIRVDVNRGYGYGILQGLRSASGEYVGWTHADMQTDPADVVRALPLLRTAGPRGVYVKGRRHGRPISDRVFTAGMGVFETLLLRKPLWDINAQPNLFPRSFFESWANPPHDFSLDLYGYYQAQRAGLGVERIAVHFGERAHGRSHWNVDWRSKWKFIKRTVEFSLGLRRTLER
jgi:glycosyltransferase involved in cell wall biosynthesis